MDDFNLYKLLQTWIRKLPYYIPKHVITIVAFRIKNWPPNYYRSRSETYGCYSCESKYFTKLIPIHVAKVLPLLLMEEIGLISWYGGIYHYLQDFTSQVVQDFFHQQFQKILIHTLMNIKTVGWRVPVLCGKSRRFIYCFPGASPLFQKLPLCHRILSLAKNRQELGTTWRNGFYLKCTWNKKKNVNATFEMQKVCHIHVDVSVFMKTWPIWWDKGINYKNLATQIKVMFGRFPFHPPHWKWGQLRSLEFPQISLDNDGWDQSTTKKQMHVAYLQILLILLFCLVLDTYLVI